MVTLMIISLLTITTAAAMKQSDAVPATGIDRQTPNPEHLSC